MNAFKKDRLYTPKEIHTICNNALPAIYSRIIKTLADCHLAVPKNFVNGKLNLSYYQQIIAWFSARPNIKSASVSGMHINGVTKQEVQEYRTFIDVALYLKDEAQLDTDDNIAKAHLKMNVYALGQDLNTSADPFAINAFADDWKHRSISKRQLQAMPEADAELYHKNVQPHEIKSDVEQMSLI